jgi:hypothetical protein
MRDEIRVGDENSRRVHMRAEHPDWLAGLDEQGFIVGESLEGCDDLIKTFPIARGAADAAVHYELVRALGDLRVEIVAQHAQRRLRQPAARLEGGAVRRTQFAGRIVSGMTVHMRLLIACCRRKLRPFA